VPLIVHVESVIHSMVFEVGYVAGDIDGCHRPPIVVGSPSLPALDGMVALWTTPSSLQSSLKQRVRFVSRLIL
jgi:hypothetical protein